MTGCAFFNYQIQSSQLTLWIWQRTTKGASAYRAYEEVSYSDPQYETIREAYYDSLDDLENFLDGINSEEDDLGGFHTQSVDQLEDDFYNLRSAIRTTYENHYDGKNTKNCIDFGDSEASCD